MKGGQCDVSTVLSEQELLALSSNQWEPPHSEVLWNEDTKGSDSAFMYNLMFHAKMSLYREFIELITLLKSLPCRIRACTTTEEAPGKGRWIKANKINPDDFTKY